MDAFGPDWLVLQIQPDEGISLQFDVKRPGPRVELAPVRMDFKYADWFRAEPNVGYETLLYDCMTGDATLFQRADMVEACWRAVQPILDDWAQRTPADFPNYASGSAGPASSDTLLAMGGRSWRPLNSAAELNARRTAKPKSDVLPSSTKSAEGRATKKRAAAKKSLRATSVKKTAPARKSAAVAKAPAKKTVSARKVAVKKATAKKAPAKRVVAARKASPTRAAAAKRPRKQ
jgi:glucose-6-phosphate 1-dehydrogenase